MTENINQFQRSHAIFNYNKFLYFCMYGSRVTQYQTESKISIKELPFKII